MIIMIPMIPMISMIIMIPMIFMIPMIPMIIMIPMATAQSAIAIHRSPGSWRRSHSDGHSVAGSAASCGATIYM